MKYKAGEFSKLAGINSETLRYYEKNNLLMPSEKTDSGYRIYNDESLKQINFIKQAKTFGFSLKEICNTQNEIIGLSLSY